LIQNNSGLPKDLASVPTPDTRRPWGRALSVEQTSPNDESEPAGPWASIHRAKLRAKNSPKTVEHPFATLKMRMGATHFLMKRLPKVATEMALHVLAYNLTRVMSIIGVQRLLAAMRACLGSGQGPAFA
jgi:hypothetical protein